MSLPPEREATRAIDVAIRARSCCPPWIRALSAAPSRPLFVPAARRSIRFAHVMPTHHRRAFRHLVELPCQVVRMRDFRLVARTALDLSSDGMYVAADVPVLTGEPLLVSFRAPRTERWIDADAHVARVVHGRRPGDRGLGLGIAFAGLDDEARHLLFQRLASLRPAPRGRRERGGHARRTDALAAPAHAFARA